MCLRQNTNRGPVSCFPSATRDVAAQTVLNGSVRVVANGIGITARNFTRLHHAGVPIASLPRLMFFVHLVIHFVSLANRFALILLRDLELGTYWSPVGGDPPSLLFGARFRVAARFGAGRSRLILALVVLQSDLLVGTEASHADDCSVVHTSTARGRAVLPRSHPPSVNGAAL